MSKVGEFLKSNFKIIALILVIVLFFAISLSRDSLKKKTTYTVTKGTIEMAEDTNVYIIKNDTLVDYDKSLPVTAIIEQGKKASKNEAIATYRNNDYDDYLKQINDIDKQIQTLVKDLPANYSTSAEIASIEKKILEYSKEIQKSTSYLKMQEYKTKLDDLAYKKINIIANATPDSSAIRDLVNKREELVKLSKQSSSTISAPVTGLVTYKIDGLENSYNFSNIENSTIQDFNKIVSDYDTHISSDFGIKIVDNYRTYLLLKTARSDKDQYIKTGYNYRLRITDFENRYITAYLIKNMQDDEYNYSLFQISNEIEDLIDTRKLACEVIWKSYNGMAIPQNAIYEENGHKYVLMVYGAEYVKVPVKIVTSSDSIAIVENYSNEEKEKMGYDTTFKLELYDELVIQE